METAEVMDGTAAVADGVTEFCTAAALRVMMNVHRKGTQTAMTEIKGLGHVRVLATHMDRWRELGFDVLGFAPGFEYATMSKQFANQRKAEAGQSRRRDFPVSSTLGRHTNEKMVSFHVGLPGGRSIEYRTGAELIDESFSTAEEITADSYWGHERKWAREMKEAQEAAASEVAQAEPADVER